MKEKVFIRLDGDNVGDSIELALMNADTKEAQNIHDRVQQGLQKMVTFIESKSGTTILMVGSDDILFSVSIEKFDLSILEEINQIFFQNTSFTLSMGVGSSISRTLNNLTKAKLSGRNRIVSDFE